MSKSFFFGTEIGRGVKLKSVSLKTCLNRDEWQKLTTAGGAPVKILKTELQSGQRSTLWPHGHKEVE